MFRRIRMPESPRVLHLSPTYFAEESVLGGAERYVQGLASAMSARTPTTLVSFGPRPFEKFIDRLRMRVFKTWIEIGGNRLNPLDLRFLAEVARHDVIHCHQIHTVVTELVLTSARLLRKPVFLTDHGGGGRTFLHRLGIARSARALLADSEYAKSRGEIEGVPGYAIYGGIDTSKFRPVARARVPRRVVTVGRMLSHKGFHHLLRALEAIPEAEIVFMGAASDSAYVDLLKRIAGKRQVTWMMNATDAEMIEGLGSAQLAVFPSTRIGPSGEKLSGEPELFGQTPLEAMACGTPSLVSDVGSYPEIALSEKMVFSDGDVTSLTAMIKSLLDDPDRCAELGKSARRHVEEKFTWNHVVDRCLEHYSNR